MKKLFMKPILLSLVCSFSLYAGTYDDSYSPLMDQNASAMMKTDFFIRLNQLNPPDLRSY